MESIWEVAAEIAIALSADRIESAARTLEGFGTMHEVGSVSAVFGPNLPAALEKRMLACWSANPDVTPSALAGALRTGAQVASALIGGQSVSIVWTGPNTEFVPVRSTEQVMLELISRAQAELILLSFVSSGAGSIVDALNIAIGRGVRIQMLLEESKGAAAKLRHAVPGALIYVWSIELKKQYGSTDSASIHAKCLIADGKEALITSANLTDFALAKNMELGVHLVGGREPEILRDHINALISTKKVSAFD